MNATPMLVTARDVARGMSIFEIDECLEALVEAAEADSGANNGEISDAIKSAIAAYAEAFGYKVDRIADFLKAQRAEAEIAHREAERFYSRQKAAENREKRLKQLLVWFMLFRNLPKLRGECNTISLQGNSTPSLVIQDPSHIPDSFYRARIDITWPEWIEMLGAMPAGSLRERLAAGEGSSLRRNCSAGFCRTL
ncbi:MAG TPA: siphovirus Gp157 family protein [Terriglobia bacterium]|jgi:hypothetical protein|nr:siphovirus Gp157 family protein [Terriglobia bacterium]